MRDTVCRKVSWSEELNATLLEVMKSAEELGYEGRYEQLAPVLEASYDFPLMIRIACGTGWRDMSAQQQQGHRGREHQEGCEHAVRRQSLLSGRGQQQQQGQQRRCFLAKQGQHIASPRGSEQPPSPVTIPCDPADTRQ